MRDLYAKELVYLMSSWKVNNEQGSELLLWLTRGLAAEDVPGVSDMNKALEEALEAINLILHALYEFEVKDDKIFVYGPRTTEQTFNSLLELRVRVENLMTER